MSSNSLLQWRPGFFGLIILAAAAFAAKSAAADAYKVDAGDQLEVTVPGEAGLTGRYRVTPQGTISFPFIGELTVSELTDAEIADKLREALASQIPVGRSLTVQVAEYAPVFVTGDVEAPGRYQFRPGMIVLELVALGGGMKESLARDLDSQVMQLLAAEQEVADLRLTRASQEVHRARLVAEIDSAEFKAPSFENLPIPMDARKQIIEGEEAVFNVREDVLKDRKKSLEDQSASYDQEIKALTESIALHTHEIELLAKETETTRSLVERGFAPEPRLLAIQRELSATKRDALELQTFLARAHQNRLNVRMQIRELYNSRANENAVALRDLDVDIQKTEQRLASALNVLLELRARITTPPAASPAQITFTVVREENGRYREQVLAENDLIQPRDILKVTRQIKAADARF